MVCLHWTANRACRGAGFSPRRTSVRLGRSFALSFASMTAVLAALLLAACSSSADLDSFGKVPNFTLTDQNDQSFEEASQLAGKVWIADFMFTTCPGPCPRMSSQMHQIQMALEDEGIQLVSFTVDPEHDTPEVLADYGARFKASPGVWHFLTGSREDLNYLCRDVFKLGEVDGSLEHSTRFVLVDEDSEIRGFYPTFGDGAIEKIMADARSLLD